jgi:D-amino peptidase
VRAGIAKRASLRPYVLHGPIRLDITFKSYTPAEIVSYLPGIQRLTSHSIRFTGKDIVEVSRFIEFLNSYQAGMTP